MEKEYAPELGYSINTKSSIEIKCLDHGHVKLVDHMGTDMSIIRAVRVSYDKTIHDGLQLTDGDIKLLNYLYQHQHSTPFEACVVMIDIKAPIFVFRQWHRHRTQSYNELSARYRELPAEYYTPSIDVIGTQSKDNKQGREISHIEADDIHEQRLYELSKYVKFHEEAYSLYKEYLASGWPKELARMVLPVSWYSHMFATANLLNWYRFLSLRYDSQAQYEIRMYASAVLKIIKSLYPVSTAAFLKYDARLNGRL